MPPTKEQLAVGGWNDLKYTVSNPLTAVTAAHTLQVVKVGGATRRCPRRSIDSQLPKLPRPDAVLR